MSESAEPDFNFDDISTVGDLLRIFGDGSSGADSDPTSDLSEDNSELKSLVREAHQQLHNLEQYTRRLEVLCQSLHDYINVVETVVPTVAELIRLNGNAMPRPALLKIAENLSLLAQAKESLEETRKRLAMEIF